MPEEAAAPPSTSSSAAPHDSPAGQGSPSKTPDATAFLIGLVSALLTWAQLPPARAALITGAIVLLLGGFLVHRHIGGTVFKWSLIGACAIGIVSCLVLVQAVPADTPDDKPVTPPTTVTTPPASTPATSSPPPPETTSPSPTGSGPVVRERETSSLNEAISRTFLKGSIRVGVPTVEDSYSSVTIATESFECRNYLDPGESMVVSGRDATWIRVALLAIKDAESVTIEVSRGTGEPPSGQECR
ncbi:hypothetical protein ACFY36_42470 [Actinoplanes sp. NPDC000266]